MDDQVDPQPGRDPDRAGAHHLGADRGPDAASLGFSLQGNAKVTEGRQHADRDAQFTYLAGQVGEHLDAGQPVISVDTKKKLRHEVARSE